MIKERKSLRSTFFIYPMHIRGNQNKAAIADTR